MALVISPGILAAIVILSVELIVIIFVIGYLLWRTHGGKKQKSEIPSGTYEPKASSTTNEEPNTLNMEDEVSLHNEKEPQETPIEEPPVSPAVVKPAFSAPPEEATNKDEHPEDDLPVSEEENDKEEIPEIQDQSDPEATKEPEETNEDPSYTDPPLEILEEGSLIETPASSSDPSRRTSLSSSNESNSFSSTATSSAPSSSDEEKEKKEEEEKEEKPDSEEEAKEEELLATAPQVNEIERTVSESSRVRSLDVGSGITLSLRIERGTESMPQLILNGQSLSQDAAPRPSKDSGTAEPLRSFSNHQQEATGIEVIRTYDLPKEDWEYDQQPQNDVAFRPSSVPSDIDTDETTEEEAVAGIINVTSGEKLTICQAMKKGLIPTKTAIFLLEAQAATGCVVNPRNGVKFSVQGAVDLGIVDETYKQTLLAAEGAYYGYLDPRTNETVCLSEAMKREIFPKNQGLRLLEAQVATGGVIDPWTGSRYSLEAAEKKGLIAKEYAHTLTSPDELMDFFDPSTQTKLNYADLLSKCIRDLDTGLKFLYIEEKPRVVDTRYQPDLLTFRSAFRKKVTLQEMIDAGLVKKPVLDAFRSGKINKEELRDILQPYLVGEEPIAGILNKTTHQVMTICEAVTTGLLRRGTALELLEAQAATGSIIDPHSGKKMSVHRAISVGLVDKDFESALLNAEQAVSGFTQPGTRKLMSLFEAMKKGIVIEIHGVRMLEAQLSTGGVIDPEAGYRIPSALALERGLFDYRIANILTTSNPDLKGYYNPNTGENTTYAEMLKRCVRSKKRHANMLLLPVIDNAPTTDLKHRGTYRHRQITITDPVTNKPLSLDQAASANVIDQATADQLAKQEGVWPDGRRS